MKKSLSLLLAIAMVVSMFASVVSAADKSAGETLKDLGVIKGTSEGLDEDKEWLRRDVTVLLSRLYGQEEKAAATANTHGFEDVTDEYYSAYVSWAKNEDLFKGKTETTFGPIDNITYGQFATVVLRALGQDQDDEAKNLAKAIELKLLPEGTVQTDNAKRGVTYTSVVAALDVTIDGKKLGTKLGLKGYEITDLAVVSASAAVAKTVVVNFNDELATVANADVVVSDADGNTVPVEKVTVDGKVATITLTSALAQKAYTVKIVKATSKAGSELANGSAEFTYTKGIPAKVEFKATTVAKSTDKAIAYVVTDANGVDITADYGVSSFDVESSNVNVVDGQLYPIEVGMAQVNLIYSDNNEVKTGNVTINVVKALTLKVSKFEIPNNKDAVLYLGSSAVANPTLEVKDDAGVVTPESATYVSSNPTVVAVENGSNAGQLTALQAGTSTITVTANYGGQKATATLVVTVKAAKAATSFEVDKTSLTVVKNSYVLPQEIAVKVLDQYGNVYTEKASEITLEHASATNGPSIIDIEGNGDISGTTNSVTVANGKTTFSVNAIHPDNGGKTGSTTLKVKVIVDGKNLGTKNVSATSVAQASKLNGYEVVVSESVIDSDPSDQDSRKKPTTSALSVYVKDSNNNRVQKLTATDYSVEFDKGSASIFTAAAGEISVAAGKTGKETFKVKVGGVTVGTYNIEAVATDEAIVAKVVQNKTSVSVGNSNVALIGNGKAFTAYNAYDEVVTGTVESAIVANDSIVTVSNGELVAGNSGTTVVTLKIKGSFYQLTVVVN